MRQIYTPRAPLPGSNGERILTYCRDHDGSYRTTQEKDRLTCRQLNADRYMSRDRLDGELWYWSELGRDILELMYMRRQRLVMVPPSLMGPQSYKAVWHGIDARGNAYTLTEGAHLQIIEPKKVIPEVPRRRLKHKVPFAGRDLSSPLLRVSR
jgi:hypothetical protein